VVEVIPVLWLVAHTWHPNKNF